MSQVKISVIICSHNPRGDYLHRVLGALERQSFPMTEWELILVDNASKQPLEGLFDLSWHPQARHIREEKLGQIYARMRGIKESRSELLAYVDDDNVLDFDYLKIAHRIGLEFNKLGCWGAGDIVPEFEMAPDSSLNPHLWLLALRSVEQPIWMSHPAVGCQVPWGAGLIFRKCVGLAYCKSNEPDELKSQLGRAGKGVGSGEDDEFSWVAGSLGMGCGIFPELKILHLIRKERSYKEYLLKVREGHAYSHLLMDHMHGIPINNPMEIPTFLTAFSCLLRGRISGFLGQLQEAWLRHRDKSLDRMFMEAAWRGKIRAWGKLKESGLIKNQ